MMEVINVGVGSTFVFVKEGGGERGENRKGLTMVVGVYMVEDLGVVIAPPAAAAAVIKFFCWSFLEMKIVKRLPKRSITI